MRKLLFLIFFVSTQVISQQTNEWLNSLENPKYPRFNELNIDNELTNYLKYDFSELFIPRIRFLGYIGKDYQRIHIKYDSILKSARTPNVYLVTGSSTVFNNTCDFEGTITVEQVREFKRMHLGVDSMYANSGFKAQGIIIARYRFNENPEQNHVGIFDGIMTMWWYVDKDGNIKFNDLNTYSDSYKNNQYVGIWREYGKLNSKPCNWGESRIPFSKSLDIGAGDFSVNPKYLSNGWQEFNDN